MTKKKRIWKRPPDNSHIILNIQSVKTVIILKERRGADASYERELLENWSTYRGYHLCIDALAECDRIKAGI